MCLGTSTMYLDTSTFSDVVATSVVAMLFFLFFWHSEGLDGKQPNFQGNWTRCQKRRPNAEQRRTLKKTCTLYPPYVAPVGSIWVFRLGPHRVPRIPSSLPTTAERAPPGPTVGILSDIPSGYRSGYAEATGTACYSLPGDGRDGPGRPSGPARAVRSFLRE